MPTDTRAHGRNLLRLLSFTAFFSTLLIYSPNVMVLQSVDTAGITGIFAEPYLLCAIVVAAGMAVLAYRMRFALDNLLERRRTVLASSALYALATITYGAVVLWVPPASEVWAVLCALGSGVAMVPVAIAWSRAFDGLDLCGAVGAMALAAGLSALANLALTALSPIATGILFALLVLAGLAWPLLTAPFSVEKPEVAADMQPADSATSGVGLKAFFSVMGVPLLGMAISSFAMGVQPLMLFDNAVDAQRVGMLLGCAALLPLLGMRRKQPIYSFIYQVYLPWAAAIALVLCVLLATGFVRDVALAGVYGFYCMVSGVAIAASCAIANAREFPRGFVFAMLIGSFCVSALLGIFLGGRIEPLASSNGTMLVLLTALYGGGMLLAGCLKSWHLMASPTLAASNPATPPEPVAETFEERLARIAVEASLSPRETQIVAYVGRGHSSVYVAKTLLISESTVYTHVRNVYRKLGVSSREELIQLLNSPATPVP